MLLTSVCAGDESTDEPGATVPTEAPTSSTTAVADVSTIPPVIDEAYLNRVLEALDAVDGMATRIIVEKKDLVPEAAQLLAAIYDDEEFKDQTNAWLTLLDREPQLQSIRPSPGNRKTTINRIISESSSCVWLATKRDYSALATEPAGPYAEYMALRPLDPAKDPKNLNPTAWSIYESGSNPDGSEPPDPCVRR